jgi:ribosomal protein L32
MCNKVTYPTKEDATTHMYFIEKNSKHRRNHKITAKAKNKHRTYQCNICGNWHLTTLAKNVTRRFTNISKPLEQQTTTCWHKCFEDCKNTAIEFLQLDLTKEQYLELVKSTDYQVISEDHEKGTIIKFNHFPGTWVKGKVWLIDLIGV